jgi:arginase
MPATFFVVPQWQGSDSSRAMRLVDGAQAIRGDLPSTATVDVDVPIEAGNDRGTLIQRLSSLISVRDAQNLAMAGRPGLAITVGGDCGVELAAIPRAVAASPEPMAVLWLDAHPDLNTPESSPSGAFTGMVLRALLGEGETSLVPDSPIEPAFVVLGGARSIDDGEVEFLTASGLRMLGADALDATSVTAALAETGARSVYIHVDLDVLDPAEFAGLSDPQPFGIGVARLVEVIVAAKAALPLAGAGIAGFAPASPEAAVDDLGSILRIVGALAA